MDHGCFVYSSKSVGGGLDDRSGVISSLGPFVRGFGAMVGAYVRTPCSFPRSDPSFDDLECSDNNS